MLQETMLGTSMNTIRLISLITKKLHQMVITKNKSTNLLIHGHLIQMLLNHHKILRMISKNAKLMQYFNSNNLDHLMKKD